jgi:hypothetical protein
VVAIYEELILMLTAIVASGGLQSYTGDFIGKVELNQ